MKTFLLILLLSTSAVAQVPSEDFCSKTQRLKFISVITDQKICSQYGKTAPCERRCGWMVFFDNCTRVKWKGCKPIEQLFDTSPTPIPTRTPYHIPTRPTVTLIPPVSTTTPFNTPDLSGYCLMKNKNYCWATGARINSNGDCFSNCTCILRGNSSGCQN